MIAGADAIDATGPDPLTDVRARLDQLLEAAGYVTQGIDGLPRADLAHHLADAVVRFGFAIVPAAQAQPNTSPVSEQEWRDALDVALGVIEDTGTSDAERVILATIAPMRERERQHARLEERDDLLAQLKSIEDEWREDAQTTQHVVGGGFMAVGLAQAAVRLRATGDEA